MIIVIKKHVDLMKDAKTGTINTQKLQGTSIQYGKENDYLMKINFVNFQNYFKMIF